MLYEKIIKVDSTGKKTVILETSAYMGMIDLNEHGYHLIKVGRPFLSIPFNQQKFVIGYELGHYALDGHILYNPHKLYKIILGYSKQLTSGKKRPDSNDFYNLNKVFDNAYSRVRESEADRFSVLNLGNDYLWGVEWIKSLGSLVKNNLYTTHPKDSSRLEQLEDLGRDLLLGRIKLQPLREADWDRIVARRRAQKGLV